VWQSKSDEIETGQHASTRFLSGAQKSKRENKTKYPQDPDVETKKKKKSALTAKKNLILGHDLPQLGEGTRSTNTRA
jgi:hypothetical protein